jgi:hypothetical protein
MVDTACDRFAQDGKRSVMILGRAEHARAGKLHGAIAEAVHGAIAKVESSGGNICHVGSPKTGVTAIWQWRACVIIPINRHSLFGMMHNAG